MSRRRTRSKGGTTDDRRSEERPAPAPSAPSRRRTWIVAAMWIAALAAVAAIYVLLEPQGDVAVVDEGEAPVFEAGDRAPSASRVGLAVEEDEGSTALYRGGRRHTGRSPFRGPARASIAWRYSASARISAQSVVGDDGTIYVGTHGRMLHAVSRTGEQRWVARAFGPVWSAAAVVDDTVYFGSDADGLFAVNAANGETRWRLRVNGDADGSLSVAPDGSLRFTGGRELYAAERDGRVRWRFRARGGFLLSTPAIDSDGTSYVGSIDDRMYAIAADGRMRWEHPTGGDISSSPVIGDDGTIYFGSDDDHVYALDRDGRRRWRTNVRGHVRAPVALGRDGSVIAGVYGPRPRVVALDAASGELRWSFPIGGEERTEAGVASGPLVDVDGNIYFGAQDDYLYSITGAGRLRWIVRLGDDIDAAPVLAADGLLLVGCDDGNLYAIEDSPVEPLEAAPDAGAADAG